MGKFMSPRLLVGYDRCLSGMVDLPIINDNKIKTSLLSPPYHTLTRKLLPSGIFTSQQREEGSDGTLLRGSRSRRGESWICL